MPTRPIVEDHDTLTAMVERRGIAPVLAHLVRICSEQARLTASEDAHNAKGWLSVETALDVAHDVAAAKIRGY